MGESPWTASTNFAPKALLAMQLPCKHQNWVRFLVGAPRYALVVKLVDAAASKAASERSVGSSPTWGTKVR